MVRHFLDVEENRALLGSLTPWPRVGAADDVARAALFLASDDAEWMTGSILTQLMVDILPVDSNMHTIDLDGGVIAAAG